MIDSTQKNTGYTEGALIRARQGRQAIPPLETLFWIASGVVAGVVVVNVLSGERVPRFARTFASRFLIPGIYRALSNVRIWH